MKYILAFLSTALLLIPLVLKGSDAILIIDVRTDPSRMSELIEISGQSKTPTLQNGDFIVPDFDLDEFEEAMSKNPEEAVKLGI